MTVQPNTSTPAPEENLSLIIHFDGPGVNFRRCDDEKKWLEEQGITYSENIERQPEHTTKAEYRLGNWFWRLTFTNARDAIHFKMRWLG